SYVYNLMFHFILHSFHLSHILFFLFLFYLYPLFSFFFFNDTATTEIYTLSLHDALPILVDELDSLAVDADRRLHLVVHALRGPGDRKSTRLNSSHQIISYAVFCLKKKKKNKKTNDQK